ncbi:hypothetical protein [Burkholderia cenocepacia]|uniref:DUF4034 domain-containing protein n=1 Tax=Burkholderia cenocepacia TaxID=95486 RepID=A0ABD4USE8_9BURK|nr:hypothetical protein [Burkholderia cenocepacia]HDR9260222.1 hypothetical protein [Burkholderia vietnamiensis]MCW3699596.1 hypothetical protein [Burkholderia cenocepacia]MCW3707203.1 hypothetical protein [Burkholderia cenocepacia]MCW3716969.1 hypothetical protein [Burkholderia cenocepacia]MCW3723476.1 hypothetical protein [Burkholderia cenocepacia]
MMYFKNSRVPIRAAERCDELLFKHFPGAAAQIASKDLTAFVLCAFDSWREMKTSWANAESPSPLDEDDEQCFVSRRIEQNARALQFLTARNISSNTELVAQFVREWQPSARYPELDVENYFAAQKRGSTGSERYCDYMMAFCRTTLTLPTEAEVRLIIENVHWAAPAWAERIRMRAGDLACDIIAKLKEDEKAEVGFRILRAVSLFNPYAKARLARFLTVGWNRKNRQQARNLVVQASEEDFDADPCAGLIYAELADAAASLADSEATPKEISAVIRILERAADHGHWKAALYLFHYYSDPSEVRDGDDPEGFYSHKVAPDKEKALYYRRIAEAYPYAELELRAAMADATLADEKVRMQAAASRDGDACKEGT